MDDPLLSDETVREALSGFAEVIYDDPLAAPRLVVFSAQGDVGRRYRVLGLSAAAVAFAPALGDVFRPAERRRAQIEFLSDEERDGADPAGPLRRNLEGAVRRVESAEQPGRVAMWVLEGVEIDPARVEQQQRYVEARRAAGARTVEMTLSDAGIVRAMTARGLVGLGLAYLMEKANLPAGAADATLAGVTPTLRAALDQGVMDAFWARILSHADRTQLAEEHDAPRLSGDTVRIALKLWSTLVASGFKNGRDFLVAAFEDPLAGLADAERRKACEDLKARVLSMLGGEFPESASGGA